MMWLLPFALAIGAIAWNLDPVEVRGQHLFNSRTGEQFRMKGMALGNPGENPQDWIALLARIRNESTVLNTVRLYDLPECALDPSERCFDAFFQEADRLGFYVLVPGTGTTWGWLPGSDSVCNTSAQCYRVGNVLGWGMVITRQFYFPNTLAFVIGNEFDINMAKHMPVIKAYVRDMKTHMRMCDTHPESPTAGKMRQIPMLYANSDAYGNPCVMQKSDYLFCGGAAESVDILGLNIERWVVDEEGRREYSKLDRLFGSKAYNGSVVFGEMGCARNAVPGNVRSWNQVVDFFTNYSTLDGFVAYTYHGNKDFRMFDGPTAQAQINEDGRRFFDRIAHVGAEPPSKPLPPSVQPCAGVIDACGNQAFELVDVASVPWYRTFAQGFWDCPPPYQEVVSSGDPAAVDQVMV